MILWLLLLVELVIIVVLVIVYNRTKIYTVPAETHKKLYKDLEMFHKICNDHGVEYIIAYGTLLGSVRHQGVIPWDDDADVFMTPENVEKLINVDVSQYGYTLKHDDDAVWRFRNVNYDYPWLDIFEITPSKADASKYIFTEELNNERWPDIVIYDYEMYPLKPYKFGEFNLWGPNDYTSLLTRMYGDNYMTPIYRHPHAGN